MTRPIIREFSLLLTLFVLLAVFDAPRLYACGNSGTCSFQWTECSDPCSLVTTSNRFWDQWSWCWCEEDDCYVYGWHDIGCPECDYDWADYCYDYI